MSSDQSSLKRSNSASNDSTPPVIDKEARRKDKKRRKLEEKQATQMPSFQFNTAGFKEGKKIGVAYIRDLALHIAADAPNPPWMLVSSKRSITSLTVLFIPGLTPHCLALTPPLPSQNLPVPIPSSSSSPDSSLPIIHKLFSHACPVRAPGDATRLHSTLNMFMQVPLTSGEKSKRENERRAKQKNWSKLASASPIRYLLTHQQMLDNDYPVPLHHHELTEPKRIEKGKGSAKGGKGEEDAGEVLERGSVAAASSKATPEEEKETVDEGQGISSSSVKALAYKDAFPSSSRGGASSAAGEAEGEVSKFEGPGWVETPRVKDGEVLDLENGTGFSCLAMDCEMCMTVDGPFLARICVVDVQTGKKVYDQMVKPPAEVTDYLTQWSGITPESLATATLTLADVQSALLSTIIGPRTILLGHSLESDLKALKLRHPWVIDTAVLFKHPRGPPFKPGLRYLAKTLLEKDIQQGTGGHDPEEDARTCLELVEGKLKLGPEFGENIAESESIFQRIARFNAPPRKTAMYDQGLSNFLAISSAATTSADCKSDDEIVDKLSEGVKEHDFCFARLSDLSHDLGWTSKSRPATSSSTPPSSAPYEAPPLSPTLPQTYANLNAQLTRLHASLPSRAALIIFTGHGDPRHMMALGARRSAFEAQMKRSIGGKVPAGEEKIRWMEDDARKLEEETAICREGLAFFCVKK